MRRQQRPLKLLVSATMTIGALAGLSFASAGTGLAASDADTHASADAAPALEPAYSATVRTQNVDGREAPVYDPNGMFGTSLRPGTQVVVTCYYFGNPPAPYVGDGYQDHIDLIVGIGYWVGHIPDRYVNLGDRTPPEYGIPQC
jgi:hypothetical protein